MTKLVGIVPTGIRRGVNTKKPGIVGFKLLFSRGANIEW